MFSEDIRKSSQVQHEMEGKEQMYQANRLGDELETNELVWNAK